MKAMTADFCINNRADGRSTSVQIHGGAIPIGEEYDKGEYVIVHIGAYDAVVRTGAGEAAVEQQLGGEQRVSITLLMQKAEARAIASALMGVAAQL